MCMYDVYVSDQSSVNISDLCESIYLKCWNVSLLIVNCIANTAVFAVVYLRFYGVNM